LAEGSPVYEALNGMAFAIGQNNAMMYQKKIIDYLIGWESTITARVDVDVVEVQKLHKILEHYETKVHGLRKKVATVEKKNKSPNAGLVQKLDRNIEKLEEAWKNHEKTASSLCNLLEEVTQRGWKDLYPVIRASMQFHQDCVRKESDIFAALSTIDETLTSIFNDSNSLDLSKKLFTDGFKMAAIPNLLPSKQQSTHQSVEDCVDENEKVEVFEDLEEEEEVDEDEDKERENADCGSTGSPANAWVSFEHEEENNHQDKKQASHDAPPSPTGVMHTIPA
jgi:hypothetical protein